MDIVYTDLTPAEFLAAQYRSIHALRGSYYREIRVMSNRTIVAVAMITATQAAATLSDGPTQYEAGGYPSIGGTPEAPNYGVALRDPASPTGAFISETPALTYEVAKMFAAAGINDKEVMETLARGPQIPASIPTAADAAAAPTTEVQHAFDVVDPVRVTLRDNVLENAAENVVVIPAHAGHATILRQFADKIERGAKVVLSEIVTELHKLV